MAYIKYKEVTKYFNFSKEIEEKNLPSYVKEYVESNEKILIGYKTNKDYGVFTDEKMILFDKGSTFGLYKQIHTIPYSTISTISITFKPNGAELSLFLNSGYPVRLKFIKMKNPLPGTPNIYKENIKSVYLLISKYIKSNK